MGNAESSEVYGGAAAAEYGTERRQPPKHLPESASYRRLDTSKLLDVLSKTFENWQKIIINMRTNQMPEHDAQIYLYQVMIKTRDKLNKIMGYMTPSVTSQLQSCGPAEKPREQHRQTASTPMKYTKQNIPGVKTLERNVEKYKEKTELYKAKTTGLILMCASIEESLERNLKERNEALLRLDRLTSETLTSTNPNLADLSDPHRPTKLGEMFSEIFDNEWTDAFEALQAAGKDDRRSIQILFETFMDIYNFCHTQRANLFEIKQKTASLLELLENDISNACTKAYLQHRRNNSCVEDLKPYVQKCLEVAWMMCIKSPPMAVAEIPQAGDPFSFVLYKPYIHKGPYIDYMVWPAILLNEKGPVISKGVAQGKE